MTIEGSHGMRYFKQGTGKPWALPNKAVRGTAARLRFGTTLKGRVRAAARDGQRSAPYTEGESHDERHFDPISPG